MKRRAPPAPRRPPSGGTVALPRLWAPWRMAYIRAATAAPARGARRQGDGGCLFCAIRPGDDRGQLVLARRPHAVLMMNRFPYNPAHLMVAVVRHAGEFRDLDAAERADFLDLTALAERALRAEYRPDGLNYGANTGRVAGAGFPGHLHLHLVPRWNGDTNFMPVIGETKVLPESLGRTWSRLRRALRPLEAAGRVPRARVRRGTRR